jgi:hypothetical protein
MCVYMYICLCHLDLHPLLISLEETSEGESDSDDWPVCLENLIDSCCYSSLSQIKCNVFYTLKPPLCVSTHVLLSLAWLIVHYIQNIKLNAFML